MHQISFSAVQHFPFEPRLFSREENNKTTRGEHQAQANKRREMLCFARPHGHSPNSTSSRAHSRHQTKRKKGVWTKELPPFVFCSSRTEKIMPLFPSSPLPPPVMPAVTLMHACMHPKVDHLPGMTREQTRTRSKQPHRHQQWPAASTSTNQAASLQSLERVCGRIHQI